LRCEGDWLGSRGHNQWELESPLSPALSRHFMGDT
jgi:hypothetical protein